MIDKKDNDEHLLQQFFNEAAHQQIEDNGFADRVMQRLSVERNSQQKLFVRVWNTVFITLFVVLFFVFHGLDLLMVHFEVMFRTLVTQSFSINLMMLFSVVFGLLLVGTGEIISSELARK